MAALVCSFSFPQRNVVYLGLGFSTELDRVKNLPYCETETFEIKFDPQGASLPVGNKEVILPIKVRRSAGSSLSSPATVTPRMSQLPLQSPKSSPNPMPHGNTSFMPVLGGRRANSSHLSPSQGDHSHYDTVLWESGVCHSSVWTVPRGNCSVF